MTKNNEIKKHIMKSVIDGHRDFRKSFFAFDEQNTIFEDNSRDHEEYSRLYLLKMIFNPNRHPFQKLYVKDIERIDCIINRFSLLNYDEKSKLAEEEAKKVSLIYMQQIKEEIDRDHGSSSIQIRGDAPDDLKEESKLKIKSIIDQISQNYRNENNSKIEVRTAKEMIELFESFKKQPQRDYNQSSSNSLNTVLRGNVYRMVESINGSSCGEGNRGDLPSVSPSLSRRDDSTLALSRSQSLGWMP